MKNKLISTFIITVLIFLFQQSVFSAANVDFEAGSVWTGYNKVRIPGDAGTKFTFTGDLNTPNIFYFRLRLGLRFFERHNVSFLFAPLRFHGSGTITRNILFETHTFNAGDHINGYFRFDSYRFTYRYDFIYNETIQLGAGLTAKIRDAEISLKDSTGTYSKKNTGFVPLVNLRLQWNFYDPFSFLLDVDALAAPQGRAEDILAAFQYHFNEHLTLKAGYRILEGGADNDTVYTFSLFHYAVFGLTYSF